MEAGVVDVTVRLTDDSESGVRRVRRNVEDVEESVRDMGRAWDDAGDAAKSSASEAESGLSGLGDSAEGASDAADAAGEGFGGLGKAAAAGLAVAAAAVTGITMAVGAFAGKLSEAMDIEQGRSRLKAQLGLTAEESAQYGQIAGSLYANAYGESLDQVNEALRYVTQNIGEGVGAAGLENVTAQVMDLADAFEEDLGPMARAAGIMVKNGLANDATEALDVLAVGFQNGANAGEDLLDTFSEYSPKFVELGIGATKAMGMISQAMNAGARDSDFAADAIKEFAIKSKDGSDTSAEAFRTLGLDANKMFQVFAKGGPEADVAMGDVLKRLNAMKDPLAQNTTAVALFGTKAEDLGSTLYAMDPTTAVAALGQVGGAAKRVGDDLADNATVKIEKFKRSLGQGLNDFMTGTVLPGLVTFAEGVGTAISPGIDRAKETWNTFTAAVRGEVTPPTWMQPIIDMIDKLRAKFDEVRPTLEEFRVNVLQKLAETWPTIEAGLRSLYDNALVPFFNFVGENSEALKNAAIYLGILAAIITGVVIVAFIAMVSAIGLVVAAVIGIVILFQRFIQIMWDVFNNVRDALGGVIDKIEELIQFFWDLAKNVGSAIMDAQRWVWSLALKAMEMRDAIVDRILDIIGWFMGLPERIRSAVGDLGDLLLGAGRAILDGLVRGFENALGWAKGRIGDGLASIRNLFPSSPAKEGPFSGRGYTTFSGQAMMEDFARGIASTAGRAASVAAQAVAQVARPFTIGDAAREMLGAINGGARWFEDISFVGQSAGFAGHQDRLADMFWERHQGKDWGAGGWEAQALRDFLGEVSGSSPATPVTFSGDTDSAFAAAFMQLVRNGQIQIGV